MGQLASWVSTVPVSSSVSSPMMYQTGSSVSGLAEWARTARTPGPVRTVPSGSVGPPVLASSGSGWGAACVGSR